MSHTHAHPGHDNPTGGSQDRTPVPEAPTAPVPLSVGRPVVRRRAGAEDAAVLPKQLRDGILALSGQALDDVSVHYDSPEPGRRAAHATAAGNQIHLASGQESRLAHEAWHVVQQRQGRVRPSQGAGSTVNDDPALESEAVSMGARAWRTPAGDARAPALASAGPSPHPTSPVVQLAVGGLEDVRTPDDVPDEWVNLYLQDLLADEAHLSEMDIQSALVDHPGWPDRYHLVNDYGDHWDVHVVTTGRVVRTRSDGSCGAHVVHVIRTLEKAPDHVFPDVVAAPGGVVTEVRTLTRERLSGERDEVRRRICDEIREQEFVFLTGFGPLLQAALQNRIESAGVSARQAMSARHDHHDDHEAENEVADEVPTIDVRTLLELPAKTIREVVDGYDLADRKGFAAAFTRRFESDFGAILRLPEDVQDVCVGYLRAAPRACHALARAGRKFKDGPRPPWLDTLEGHLDQVQRSSSELQEFTDTYGYTVPKGASVHDLYDHDVLSIYPIERKDESTGDGYDVTRGGKGGRGGKGAQESQRKRVHRPILDLEVVDGRFFARCYLGMFAKGEGGRKDVTADSSGAIEFRDIGLMNLGNPFKAMLWCEDYLSSNEHDRFKPDPVVRSFLVPLSSAAWMLDGTPQSGARPLDQDRGSGQFGNYGSPVYAEKLEPLVGSLVSFFMRLEELELAETNQVKLPMSALQEHLTGTGGDLRDMSDGIAAQHDRKGHSASFSKGYVDALTAYYDSLRDTGFTDATATDDTAHTGKWKRDRPQTKVKLTDYPHVVRVFARMRRPGPKVRWT